MDVATITMDPKEAKERLKPYRDALRRRADAEYDQVAQAYEALARGTPLLSLAAVFAAAPRDEKGRPRLAVARADRRQVRYTRTMPLSWRSGVERFDTAWQQGRGSVARDAMIEIPLTVEIAGDHLFVEGYSMVPIVPPAVRGTRKLAEHFTLWEAEAWSDRMIGAQPDRDPYLLQRITRDLYAVVGEWDLTDVERMVMMHRVDAQ